MMRRGFLDEVVRLRERGDLTSRSPSMRAVGYRQLWEHLEGRTSLAEAVERTVAATRQLAKRQLTWLRSDKGITWLDPDAPGAFDRWNHAFRALSDKFGR
jgi:tRNA dimethylallyltransferase